MQAETRPRLLTGDVGQSKDQVLGASQTTDRAKNYSMQVLAVGVPSRCGICLSYPTSLTCQTGLLNYYYHPTHLSLIANAAQQNQVQMLSS